VGERERAPPQRPSPVSLPQGQGSAALRDRGPAPPQPGRTTPRAAEGEAERPGLPAARGGRGCGHSAPPGAGASAAGGALRAGNAERQRAALPSLRDLDCKCSSLSPGESCGPAATGGRGAGGGCLSGFFFIFLNIRPSGARRVLAQPMGCQANKAATEMASAWPTRKPPSRASEGSKPAAPAQPCRGDRPAHRSETKHGTARRGFSSPTAKL